MKPNAQRNNISQFAASSAQVGRAADYVIDNWFPANPQLHSKIKSLLANENVDCDLILAEVKKDCALYLYCIKELNKKIKTELGANQNEIDPVQSLQQADLDALKQILLVPESKISSHSFNQITPIQANRLNHAMISASTAEVLADHIELDSETGFSCALLRQLGITLIAWNYPHVYEKAMASLTLENNLDTLLSKFLGFTPTLLAIHIAKEWQLPVEIRGAIGDRKALLVVEQENPKLKNSCDLLSKICKIGETLAKINDPEHYPVAKGELELVQEEIISSLGTDGFNLIKEKILENCSSYVEKQPELFDLDLNKSSSIKIGYREQIQNLIIKNTSIKFCPKELQEQLKKAYSEIIPGKVSKLGITLIASHIIPAAGFKKGCIYLVEPERQQLAPRLRIGASQLADFRNVSYYSSETDLIATAFRCSSIVKEERAHEDGGISGYIAGSLGNYEKAGVLFLELGRELFMANDNQAAIRFKAIRQAITDCMALE